MGEGLSHESFGYRPHVYQEAISESGERGRVESVKSWRAIGFSGVVPAERKGIVRGQRG